MENVTSIAHGHELATGIGLKAYKITSDNYDSNVLTFRDRQAGIGVVFDPDLDRYYYNVYCIETKLLKELFSCEYEFLADALDVLNAEFGTWDKVDLGDQKGCGSCAAK